MDKADTLTTTVGQGTLQQNWLLAYDFETFAKSATESGINVADRALPVSLELTRQALVDSTGTGRAGVESAAGGRWCVCVKRSLSSLFSRSKSSTRLFSCVIWEVISLMYPLKLIYTLN